MHPALRLKPDTEDEVVARIVRRVQSTLGEVPSPSQFANDEVTMITRVLETEPAPVAAPPDKGVLRWVGLGVLLMLLGILAYLAIWFSTIGF